MSKDEYAKYVNMYMDTIYRVAYSWTRNPDDANDVTQDVLIQLYKTTKVFESDAHLKHWLIRVTINQCKMLFRSPWSTMEDVSDYAETLGFEEECYLDLFQAVMKLDKKYRIPLLLLYYEGYSTAEISSILQIPEKTVSTRIHRAKAKLKSYLKEE